MRPGRKVLLAVIVIAVLGLIVVASLRSRGDQALEVYAEAAEVREMVQEVEASGEIDPRVKVKISAHVVGRIERLFVEEGDRIEAGAPFLELEREAFVAARDQAAAQLASSRTAVRQAEVDLADARAQQARFERLAAQGITSQEQLDARRLATTSAELSVDRAREAVRQAEASLVKARDDLAKTTIFSPIAGRVVELNAEQGEVVVSGTMNNPASVIGTIADLSEILAVVDVDETEIVEVEPGQPVEVRVDAVPGAVYHGEVVEVGSSGYARSRQPDVTYFKVEVLLTDADQRLRPGMSARVAVRTAVHPEALAVPIQAVREDLPEDGDDEADEGSSANPDAEPPKAVFVVADGVATRRRVTTGISDATHVEITEGLSAGEVVISGPYRTLRDLEGGEQVQVVEPGNGKDDDEKNQSADKG
jgi:HlyD family secretion protein